MKIDTEASSTDTTRMVMGEIPERLQTMSTEDLKTLTEAQLHALISEINVPEVILVRQKVQTARTSTLLSFFSGPVAFFESWLGEDCFEKYDGVNGEWIISACALAVSDEIDRRIPCPERAPR